MKDDRLISLNAAIDALKRAEALVRAFGYHAAIDAVQALPSAQPEQRLIPCEKCWHGCPFPIHTERRQDADSSGNMSGTQKELKCTETHDLVSRGAALEAMDTWDKFGCDPDGKLVRYDDDKHYIPYVHYEDMVHAIKYLPPAQPGWIPCSRELPKKDGDYLVTTHSGQIARYIFIGGSSEEYWRRCATAWMPLPTPYREGRKE